MLKKTLTFARACDFLLQHRNEAHDLYITRDFTARQLASHFNFVFNQNFQKACFEVFGVKGKGLGGARVGSGNKKDWKELRSKKADYHQIVINVSPNSMKILKESGEKHTDYIERAIAFYAKAQQALRGATANPLD